MIFAFGVLGMAQGSLVLNNRADYLGDDRPVAGEAVLYNGAIMLCSAVVLASVTYSTLSLMGM